MTAAMMSQDLNREWFARGTHSTSVIVARVLPDGNRVPFLHNDAGPVSLSIGVALILDRGRHAAWGNQLNGREWVYTITTTRMGLDGLDRFVPVFFTGINRHGLEIIQYWLAARHPSYFC